MAIRRLTSEFGTDLIATGDIATGAITTDKIGADAITSTKIAADAVTTTKILDSTTTTLACVTNSSTTVTHTTATLIVGTAVSGGGIPIGATIASVQSTTSFTLSATATTSVDPITLTFVTGITAGKIAADAVGTTAIAAGAIGATELGTTLDLSSHTVTVPAATITAHVTTFDDSKIRNDVGTLALHSAIANDRVAHNLPNVFIDQFQDESQVTLTTAMRINEAIQVSGTAPVGIGIDIIGTVTHSTVKAKWGQSSFKVAGGVANHLYWDMEDAGAGHFDRGSGDWTIEFWYMLESNASGWISLTAASDTADVGTTEYGQGSGANVADILFSATANELYYRLQGTPLPPKIFSHTAAPSNSAVLPSVNTAFFHIAVVRDGNQHRFYVDGSHINSLNIAPNTAFLCATTNASITVTCASTSTLIVGHIVTFSGGGVVPAGTTVASIVNSTTFTLSAPATVDNSSITLTFSYTGVLNNMRHFYISNPQAYFDDFRVSDIARYTVAGSITPPTSRFVMDDNTMILLQSINQGNGTNTMVETTRPDIPDTGGSIVGANQPALSAAVTKMGIVILYKDLGSGTTILNTDLVAQVRADGITYTSITNLIDAGTFSTGIKIASAAGITVSAGTIPNYKISFVNQGLVKNTEIHGVALLY